MPSMATATTPQAWAGSLMSVKTLMRVDLEGVDPAHV